MRFSTGAESARANVALAIFHLRSMAAMAKQPAAKKLKKNDSTASGAGPQTFDPSMHAGMLGLPLTPPTFPQKPSEDDIVFGNAPALCDWVTEAWKSVYYRMSVHLFEDQGVALRLPLNTQRTPEMQPAKAKKLSSFREPWNMSNCCYALNRSGMYEASMTIWQFLPTVKTWNDIDLSIEATSWQQLESCMGFWSESVLKNSSEVVENQRFIFPGFLSTCLESLITAETLLKSGAFFRDLPACGGNVVLWSLLVAMHDALVAGDFEKVLKLYEASITVTVRMRLHPSATQLQLDQMTFVDVLRTQGLAHGATSFYEFAVSCLRLPEVTGQESGPEITKKLEELGVQFKGKKIDRNIAYSILSLVGVASSGRGREAVRFLERIAPSIFIDHSKILRTFQIIRKMCGADEWQDVVVCLMEGIGVSILSGDATCEEFHGELLVPKARRATGYVHGQIVKRKFCKWFLDEQVSTAASGASNALSVEGLMSIKAKCFLPRAFWQNFCDSAAPVQDIKFHS